jgi:hypothetical protein
MPYVASRSLRRRKGFGALNCPGDPACPGYVPPFVNAVQNDPAGASNEDFWAALDWFKSNATPNQATPGQTDSLTSFLNGNAGKIAIGAGVLFGVVLLGKAMR